MKHSAKSRLDLFGNRLFGAILLGHQLVGFVAVGETFGLGLKQQLLDTHAERDIAQLHQAGA